MFGYPTKEEILANEMEFPAEVLECFREWKKYLFNKSWAAKEDDHKFRNLDLLVRAIAAVYGKPRIRIKQGYLDCYSENLGVICLTKPSIITALHELGHHLFGYSELDACRFSVWLFKLIFPKQFESLVWQGHMLVKASIVLTSLPE